MKKDRLISAILMLGSVGVFAMIALGQVPSSAPASEPGETMPELSQLVRAEVRLDKQNIRQGQPVWAHFSLTNLTDQPLTLWVPDWPDNQLLDIDMGLPIEHIFSGKKFTALTIENMDSGSLDAQVYHRPAGPVPVVRLAPNGSVGRRFELSNLYRVFRQTGEYQIVWKPYNGSIESAPARLTVMAERQAVIDTNFGKMTMRFYYDEAPQHVKNFIELVEDRFYNAKTFHRVIPGGLIQGGCPRGDGYGIRPDGKRLKAEFSQIPFEAGTVGMARAADDPHSASCQFFICLSRQPSLDGNQTAFGYLVGADSFETLRKIASVQTTGSPKFRPVGDDKVYIRTISLENVPRERNVEGISAKDVRSGDIPDQERINREPASVLRVLRKGQGDEASATQPRD